MYFVCLILFTVCLNIDAVGITNLSNPTRQEAKATMRFLRVIGDDNLNGSFS